MKIMCARCKEQIDSSADMGWRYVWIADGNTLQERYCLCAECVSDLKDFLEECCEK